MWTKETADTIAKLQMACMVNIPDTDHWYRVHWVDGDGTPTGIVLCLVYQSNDGGDEEGARETLFDYQEIKHWKFKVYADLIL